MDRLLIEFVRSSVTSLSVFLFVGEDSASREGMGIEDEVAEDGCVAVKVDGDAFNVEEEVVEVVVEEDDDEAEG